MARGQDGKRTRVHDPQPPRAVHARPRVDDGHGVVRPAHLARRSGVPHGREGPADEVEDVGVALDAWAREVFLADGDVGHELPDLARALKGRDGELLVGGVGDPVWVDEGRVGRAGAGDGDVAAAEGADEHGGHGGVVVPVQGVPRCEVGRVAQDGADGDEFDLGPVGREGAQGLQGRRGEGGAVGLRDLFPAEDGDDGVCEGAGRVVVVQFYRLGFEVGVVHGGGRGGDVDLKGGAPEDVVLHVLADAGEIFEHGDAMAFEYCSRADAGNHEYLRRLETPRREYHLAFGAESVGWTGRLHVDSN